jgi:hypothetical protein
MFAAFLFSARLYFKLWARSLSLGRSYGRPGWGGRLLRILLFLLATPLWLLHWLCLLLDELLFPGYKQQPLDRPVFILGVPRSGTTHLHRTLAEDRETFSSVSTWEVFLAPSILQRYFWLGLGHLDALFGGPGKRLLGWLESKLFAGLEGVHDIELSAAEEDYLLLLPLVSCFILFLPFCSAEHIWRLSRFDWDMPEKDRRIILAFYRAMLQKHMVVFGGGRRYLSKNAAFASWIQSLEQEFSDAQFIVCLREPEATLPSLLGSVAGAADFFSLDMKDGAVPGLLTDAMAGYYEHLIEHAVQRWPVVPMHLLKENLVDTVQALYRRLDLDMSAEYAQQLAALAEQAKHYRSQTRPLRSETADQDTIRQQFSAYYDYMESAARPARKKKTSSKTAGAVNSLASSQS